jgi:uncharacterized protein
VGKFYYENPFVKSYFWRTTTQQEIDYIEVENEQINAFEIKSNENAKIKKFDKFKEAYQTDVNVIHKKNFRDLLI